MQGTAVQLNARFRQLLATLPSIEPDDYKHLVNAKQMAGLIGVMNDERYERYGNMSTWLQALWPLVSTVCSSFYPSNV